MFRKIATQPLLALCLGFPACAADGVAHAQSHAQHAVHDDGAWKRCASTDDIVDSISTALAVSRKYQDVAVAEAEGYKPVSPCEASPEGTMGIHYAHDGKLAAAPDVSTTADPRIPAHGRRAAARCDRVLPAGDSGW